MLSPMTGPLFAASDVACLRAERLVFTRLSFTLGAGEALILRGPNGSGKSSLLRLLSGLARAEAGSITWGGTPIRADAAAHRARLHFIGHQDALKPVLGVAEILEFWAGMRGDGDRRRVEAALEHFRLTRLADTPCRLLSAGERKRVALARLVATRAELWLLDEPTNSLDAAAAEDLLRAVAGHRAGGGRLVVASHDPLAIPGAATLALDRYAPKPRARVA
jgi:heme exporter protein A